MKRIYIEPQIGLNTKNRHAEVIIRPSGNERHVPLRGRFSAEEVVVVAIVVVVKESFSLKDSLSTK